MTTLAALLTQRIRATGPLTLAEFMAEALGHPQLVTWLQVASLFIKVPLSIWFTLGGAFFF